MPNRYSLIALVLGGFAAPAVAGQIQIHATQLSDPQWPTAAVVLDVTVDDTGAVPTVRSFGIRRRALYPCDGTGWQNVACMPRQAGTTTRQFYDTGLPTHTSFVYDVVGYTSLSGCSGAVVTEAVWAAFDPTSWGFPIFTAVAVGPGPTPLAHGVVLPMDVDSQFPIATCADACLVHAYRCNGAAAAAYAGTGTEVLLYGSVAYQGNCCGYSIVVSQVEPHPCPPIGVQPAAWSAVKRLYRDATR